MRPSPTSRPPHRGGLAAAVPRGRGRAGRPAADRPRGDRDGSLRRPRARLRQRRRRAVRARPAARGRPRRRRRTPPMRWPTSCAACSPLPAPDPPLLVDADLRPEGRQGPLVRTLDSYAAYYAPVVAGVGEPGPAAGGAGGRRPRRSGRGSSGSSTRSATPHGGLRSADVREIRRIKARVEAERLPRGADPATHTKLGRGGLADVEWTVQLLQLRHAAARCPSCARPAPSTALDAAASHGLVDPADAETLTAAWHLATRVRNAIVLVRGGADDSLPQDQRELAGVARLVGYPPGSTDRPRRGLPTDHPSGPGGRRTGVLRVSGPSPRGELRASASVPTGPTTNPGRGARRTGVRGSGSVTTPNAAVGLHTPTPYRRLLDNREIVGVLSGGALSAMGDQAARAVLALDVLPTEPTDAGPQRSRAGGRATSRPPSGWRSSAPSPTASRGGR